MPPLYTDFQVMRIMGWDYYTFENQPDWFIYAVKKFLDAENRVNDKIRQRNNNG